MTPAAITYSSDLINRELTVPLFELKSYLGDTPFADFLKNTCLHNQNDSTEPNPVAPNRKERRYLKVSFP